MNRSNHIVSFENISVGYTGSGTTNIVQEGLTGKAGRGELVALVGANGTGKSTLLRTIAGFLPEIRGSIKINGTDVSGISRVGKARIMAFVGTQSTVPPGLTVREIISLGRFPYTNWIGNLNEKDIEIVRNVASGLGLETYFDRAVGEISDGELQKVLICRALAQEPSLLLLDEPTAFLDLPNRYEMVRVLKRLADEKELCIIFSTHDLQVALREVDKIWLMPGEGLEEGSPEDLILNHSFSNLFKNSPLTFSEDEMTWSLDHENSLKLRIQASGRAGLITLKLLRRLGIREVNNHDTPLLKVIKSRRGHAWEIDTGSSVKQFSTLYDLALYLKNLCRNL